LRDPTEVLGLQLVGTMSVPSASLNLSSTKSSSAQTIRIYPTIFFYVTLITGKYHHKKPFHNLMQNRPFSLNLEEPRSNLTQLNP
jgi:hypothetical protein